MLSQVTEMHIQVTKLLKYEKENNHYLVFMVLFFLVPVAVNAFSFEYVNQYNYNNYWNEAGFLSGIWHGLIAPYSLFTRLLTFFSPTFGIDIYAIANTGWFYDFGFLIGVLFSLPIGWLAAIIAFIALLRCTWIGCKRSWQKEKAPRRDAPVRSAFSCG